VHPRPFRSLSALTFASALFLGLVPSASAAGTKEKDAQKLYDSAINEDYLNADFAKAEKKLKDAVTKCGSDCSDELTGKLHVALGTVYAVGLSKPDDAKAEFVVALKADPKAALDPSLTTPDLTKIFEEAKKASAAATPKPPEAPPKPTEPTRAPPSSDATHTPSLESPVNTPLPIYVEPSDEVPLSKVTLRYKPFGATQYKSIEMKKMGSGFGGEIPCEDVTTTGDVKYFFVFTGDDGEGAGGLGSSKEPFKTTIKNEIEGDAPKLPGKKAPEQCKEKGDCPPGLPGCEPAKGGVSVKRGDKGWGSSCDQSAECKEGLTCLNGTCDEDRGGDKGGGEGGDESAKKKRMNLVGAGVQLDWLILGTASDVCATPSPSNHICFIPGTSRQVFSGPPPGFPILKIANTDGITGGGAFAGARLLAAYDRQILKKIGLTLGVRIGYAFGGPGAPANVDAHGNPTVRTDIAPNKAFIPFHGEARIAYYLLGSMMDPRQFRPYVFAGGGFGQANASVPVQICDTNLASGEMADCPGGKAVLRTVNAYQITGLDFIDFGGGTTFGITPVFGLSAELKFMFMFPTFGVVISPSIGPVFNF
jgi:hypothetical protein